MGFRRCIVLLQRCYVKLHWKSGRRNARFEHAIRVTTPVPTIRKPFDSTRRRAHFEKQSGREDLNLRPHGPEPCALAKLSYAPLLRSENLNVRAVGVNRTIGGGDEFLMEARAQEVSFGPWRRGARKLRDRGDLDQKPRG